MDNDCFCDRCVFWSEKKDIEFPADFKTTNNRRLSVGMCRMRGEEVWSEHLCEMFVSIGEPSVEVAILRNRVKALESKLEGCKCPR